MYSDRNFEIRSEYRERPPSRPHIQRPRPPEDSDDLGDLLIRALFGGFIVVVILFAAVMLVAIVGWLWSFTLVNPQHKPLTERSQYEQHLQEERGSSARPSGGGGNSNPSA